MATKKAAKKAAPKKMSDEEFHQAAIQKAMEIAPGVESFRTLEESSERCRYWPILGPGEEIAGDGPRPIKAGEEIVVSRDDV